MASTPYSTDTSARTEGYSGSSMATPERVRETTGEFGRLIADVEDLVKKVAHLNDADIARVRQKVETTLATAKTSVQQGTARVRDGSRQLARATDGYVHERPWTALGIAAVAGAVLGMMSRRRHH
jgi:ElaB/YqjD/DUF883 family membrane-anchored ribosome-binding protein